MPPINLPIFQRKGGCPMLRRREISIDIPVNLFREPIIFRGIGSME
jgi:hypothetical protein